MYIRHPSPGWRLFSHVLTVPVASSEGRLVTTPSIRTSSIDIPNLYVRKNTLVGLSLNPEAISASCDVIESGPNPSQLLKILLLPMSCVVHRPHGTQTLGVKVIGNTTYQCSSSWDIYKIASLLYSCPYPQLSSCNWHPQIFSIY